LPKKNHELVFKSKKVWAWVAKLLSAPKVAWQGTLKQKNKKNPSPSSCCCSYWQVILSVKNSLTGSIKFKNKKKKPKLGLKFVLDLSPSSNCCNHDIKNSSTNIIKTKKQKKLEIGLGLLQASLNYFQHQ